MRCSNSHVRVEIHAVIPRQLDHVIRLLTLYRELEPVRFLPDCSASHRTPRLKSPAKHREDVSKNMASNAYSTQLQCAEHAARLPGLPPPAHVVNGRACARLRLRCWVVLCWHDNQGRKRKVLARTVDVSGTGVMLESAIPLRTGEFVQLRSKKLLLIAGNGHVRHCQRDGWKFRIGLQFAKAFTARF